MAERGESVPDEEGEIVTTSGEVLGRHQGLHRFTVGQRRGLGVAVGRPLYVVSLDRGSNRVIVGEDEELRSAACDVRDVNWIPFAFPERPVARHREDSQSPRSRERHSRASGRRRRARVQFDEPQRAVTPGQAAIFYDGEIVLGGGWIV